MRLLAPLLVAATVVLFGSGVAMGVLHGHALQIARRLHGPSSVIWLVLIAVHVVVYLRRALIDSSGDLRPATRSRVPGATWRSYALAATLIFGVVAGAATIPSQHRWIDLPRHHDRNPPLRTGSAQTTVARAIRGGRKVRSVQATPSFAQSSRVRSRVVPEPADVRTPAEHRYVPLGSSLSFGVPDFGLSAGPGGTGGDWVPPSVDSRNEGRDRSPPRAEV